MEDEAVPTMQVYEDGYQYQVPPLVSPFFRLNERTTRRSSSLQNIMGPLVTMEADEDKHLKERQREDGVHVSWSEGLNGSTLARFRFARYMVHV